MSVQTQPPMVVAVGAAHPDRRGRISGATIMGASNPGSMAEDVGGGAFNAARALALRGLSVALMSARGGDTAGETVQSAIEKAGITDRSAVFLDRATPGYTAILGADGDVVVALADMNLYETGLPRHLRRRDLRDLIANADAVLVDANLPARAIADVAALRSGLPLFAVAISPAKADRLSPAANHITALFCNRREASALSGLPADSPAELLIEAMRERGFRSAVISDGARPLAAYDGEGAWAIQPPAPGRIADVTGAGDALAGATVAALLHRRPLADAVRQGVAATVLTLRSARAVADSLEDADMAAIMADTAPAAPLVHQPEPSK